MIQTFENTYFAINLPIYGEKQYCSVTDLRIAWLPEIGLYQVFYDLCGMIYNRGYYETMRAVCSVVNDDFNYYQFQLPEDDEFLIDYNVQGYFRAKLKKFQGEH